MPKELMDHLGRAHLSLSYHLIWLPCGLHTIISGNGNIYIYLLYKPYGTYVKCEVKSVIWSLWGT